MDALGRRAAVAFQLRVDPLQRRAITIRALAAIAEAGQAANGFLIALQLKPPDQGFYGLIGAVLRNKDRRDKQNSGKNDSGQHRMRLLYDGGGRAVTRP
jgi:hypothetical protein